MRTFLLACFCAAALPGQASAQRFEGELSLAQGTCPEGEQQLGQDFGFVDATGRGWLAAAGNCTDGASIPRWARPLIAEPFDDDVIRAAVLHDHYCDRHVVSWPQTHRMFFDALLISPMPRGKALILYYAVLIGGPQWYALDPGRPCSLGTACINQYSGALPMSGLSALASDDGGQVYVVRPGRYEDPLVQAELQATAARIEALDDSALQTPEQVEQAALDLETRALDFLGPFDDFVLYAQSGRSVGPGLDTLPADRPVISE